MSNVSATDSSMRWKYCVWALRQGAIAPSAIDCSGSGITSSGSTSNVVPSPSHVSHAPYGELNEKLRGAGSSYDVWHTGHARCWLNVINSGSLSGLTISNSATPSASCNAVSSESVRRRSMPSRSTSRSTTISILCCS